MKRVLSALILLLPLVLGACAVPQFAFPGPPVVSPAVADGRFHAPDAVTMPLRSWLPPEGVEAVVLALHGFNDYSNAFEEPGKYLAARGIAVYAYDQRGFGNGPHRGFWPGSAALADDVRHVSRLLAEKHPGLPFFILGESMGGAVAMLALTTGEAPPVDGVILSAPAVWGRQAMNVFERAGLWLATRTVPGMKLTGQGFDIKPSDNIEMLRALSRDPLVIKETRVDTIGGLVDLMDEALAAAPALDRPALVLYGEKDEIVPKAPTYRMMDELPDRGGLQCVAVYPEGYHMLMRDLQAGVVLADIASWIKSPDRPLPSGADLRAMRILAR